MLRVFPAVLLNIILGLGFVATNTMAASPLEMDSSTSPIHIEADRMESDQKKEAVVFAGSVEAIQGDMVIKADEMTVHYRKTGSGSADLKGGQSIKSLQAVGNVKIDRQDWRAAGDRMDYETEGRKVVMTGNTKVWQGSNMVAGDRVVLYLDEGKSIVEDQDKENGGRVKAFFYPDSTSPEAEQKDNKEN